MKLTIEIANEDLPTFSKYYARFLKEIEAPRPVLKKIKPKPKKVSKPKPKTTPHCCRCGDPVPEAKGLRGRRVCAKCKSPKKKVEKKVEADVRLCTECKQPFTVKKEGQVKCLIHSHPRGSSDINLTKAYEHIKNTPAPVNEHYYGNPTTS